MTTSNPTIAFDMTSDATFQTWTQAIHNALTTVGLVQTADTGQINFSTTTRGTGGYAIYRFSDTLQSTAPIYLKIVFGNGGTSSPAWTVQLGTGTNGAGTLTGTYTQTAGSKSAATASTTAVPCYFSSDGSYLVMACGVGPAGAGTIYQLLVVDRTRNSDGSANTDGLYAFVFPWSSVNYPQCNALRFSGTAQLNRNWGYGTNAVFPNDNGPSASPTGAAVNNTGVVGTDIMIFPHVPYCPEAEYPALAAVGVYQSDVAVGVTFSATVNGAAHTYLALGAYAGGMGWNVGGSGVASHGVAVRYE